MLDHAENAKRLLLNYFQAIASQAGMHWHSDYSREIEQAVDDMIEAAVERMRQELNNLSQDTES